MPGAELLIEVENLTRRFPKCEALGGLSFRSPRGEILGILGPNGSGKTTLLRVLATVLAPTSGHVRIAGFHAFRDPLPIRRRVGYLPESTPLYREMRVQEYLAFRGRIKGLRGKPLANRLRETIDRCGLGEVAGHPVGTLSRGFRQRTGLADALLLRPDILLLDEPFAGLDAAQAGSVRDLIREYGRDGTVLLSTHHLAGAEELCHRALVLNGGRLAALDTPAALVQASRRLQAEIQAPTDELGRELEPLPGFQDARIRPLDDGWSALSVRIGAADPLPALEAAAAARGWSLRAVRTSSRRFEDAVLRLTTLPPKIRNPRKRSGA